MAKPETHNAEALMSDFLDKQLDEAGEAELKDMLASSPEAEKELSALQNMLRLVKNLPEVEAPPDFYDKVAKKIRRRKWLSSEHLIALSLPFQILNVLVILAVAVVYMMLHLDTDAGRGKLERDPTVQPPPGPPTSPSE